MADPFVDNTTLMVALFDAQSRTKVLTEFVCEHAFFKEIDANEMVKSRLVDFLKADQTFRQEANSYTLLSGIVRKNPWSKIRKDKEERLSELQELLTKAFNELEMIRKLALPNNTLLMLKPFEFTPRSKSYRSRLSKQ